MPVKVVDATDYDALHAEAEALQRKVTELTNQRDAILLQARCWAGEAKAQQAITKAVGEALGGVPDWGPIAAGVEALRVSVPKRQTLNNLARDGELIASGWNACLDEFSKLNPGIEQVSSLLEWAVSRWEAEVSLRPLHNVHRRLLDDTWRQVIRRIGGDDKALCGPSHDELIANHAEGGKV